MGNLKASFQKLYEFIIRRELIVLYFIGLSVFFIFILKQTSNFGAFDLLIKNPKIVFGTLLLSIVFALMKSFAWLLAWHSQEINISYFKSWKLFQVSCFVDFLVFPSRVSSDIYKIANLKSYSTNKKLLSVLLFRVGTTVPYLIGIFIYFLMSKPIWLLTIIPLIILAVFLKRKSLLKLKGLIGHLKSLFYIFLITSFLIALEWVRASLILSLFNIPFSFNFFLWWILSHVIGTISGLPLGLGAKDFSLGVYFKDLLTLDQIGLFLILIRLTGEIFNAFIGWVLSGKETIKLVVTRNRDLQ